MMISKAAAHLVLLSATGLAWAQEAPAPAGVTKPEARTPRTTDAIGTACPDWAREARWYIIDVSRFANGDKANDPEGTQPGTTDWPTVSSVSREQEAALCRRRFGGDLKGLTQRLPYLKDLGVNTLLLEGLADAGVEIRLPVAQVRMGSEAAPPQKSGADSKAAFPDSGKPPARGSTSARDRLFAFVKAAHRAGFRVVLPAAPADAGTERAQPGNAITDMKSWFDPNGDGKLDDGIDGWLVRRPAKSIAFWKGWRKACKSVNPKALLVVDAPDSDHPWLAGDTFDVAWDHDTADLVRRFFGGKAKSLTLTRFAERLAELASQQHLGAPSTLSDRRSGRLLTFLSSGKPAVTQADDHKAAAVPADPITRWRLATILHHFLPQAPATLYGDEVGLRGGTGELARAPMPWPDLRGTSPKPGAYRGDFASLVRWLNFRRNLHAPLRHGRMRVAMVDDARGILVVERSLPGDAVFLVMNFSEKKQRVVLKAARPGQLVGVLSPHIVPVALRGLPHQPRPPEGGIKPLVENGARQFADAAGRVPFWVDPGSIRVVLVKE